MATTPTNAAFLTAIQGITVTGVVKHFDYPPLSLNTGDLPAAFPLLPNAGQGEPLATCISLSKTRNIQFVICIEPVGQSVQVLNYGKLTGLMDNLETKLDALKDVIANFIEYDINTTTEFAVADINYWTIVADVRARSG